MPKPKLMKLSEDDKQALVESDSLALKIGTVVDGLLKAKLEDVQNQVNGFSGKMNNITIGVVLGTAFLFISLIVGYVAFMAGMKQSYFQTQDSVNTKINELIENNASLKGELQRKQDSLEEKQNYIERLLLEK
jgi:hypothetical protein